MRKHKRLKASLGMVTGILFGALLGEIMLDDAMMGAAIFGMLGLFWGVM